MISLAKGFEDRIDFVPQAIVAKPIGYFEDRLGGFDRMVDDLDYYEGATFSLDGSLLFALRHYDGFPAGTVTIYLDGNIRDTGTISEAVQRIAAELEVEDAIHWRRAPHALPESDFRA